MLNIPFSSTSMINLSHVTNDIVTEPKCLSKEKQKKKSSSWLASLARSKSLRRTSLRLQKWLSSDNLLKQQKNTKTKLANKMIEIDNGDYGFMDYYNSSDSSRSLSDAFVDKHFFSSINCHEKLTSKNSAEFYPGASGAHATANPAKRNNLVRSMSGAVNQRRTDRRFPVQRSQSYILPPREFLPATLNLDKLEIAHDCKKATINAKQKFSNLISGQNFQPNHIAHIKVNEPMGCYGRDLCRKSRGRSLHRSMSMSAQLDGQRPSIINDGLPFPRRFQNPNIIGPTDVLKQKENVVFHYPPNGRHNRPVLHLPKISNDTEADHINNFSEDQRVGLGKMRLHERRSQSLDTLLEELSDHSTSPLPPPVFEDIPDRLYTNEIHPGYDIPTNNCKVFYLVDDYLSPANQSSLTANSLFLPKAQHSMPHSFVDSVEIDKNELRPNVASFSSSSPDSNDESLNCHTTRSDSPIYAKLNFLPHSSLRNMDEEMIESCENGLLHADSINTDSRVSVFEKNNPDCRIGAGEILRMKRSQTPGNRRNTGHLYSPHQSKTPQQHRYPLQIHPAFVTKSDLVSASEYRWRDMCPLPEIPAATSFLDPSRFQRRDVSMDGRARKTPALSPVQRRLVRRLSLAEPFSHKTVLQQQRRGQTEAHHKSIPRPGHLDKSGLTNRVGLVVNQRAPLGVSANQLSGSQQSGVCSLARSSEKTSYEGAQENQPVSPNEAVRLYGRHLTDYEHREICQYDQIWYVGASANKVRAAMPDAPTSVPGSNPANNGFDDDQGNYIKISHDHIGYRYEVLDVIGRGSFGQVIRALDHKNNVQVAIKIIRNKKRFHQQALMEVKILDHLRRVDQEAQEKGQVQENGYNVVRMLDCFYFREHLCVVFQLLGLNLFELIKRNNYRGLSLALIRKFACSMVQCLQLLHREGIIHCDLKPENVLLKAKNSTSIRIIDFGSSCYSHQRVYTYIQSRFYRSPEVILGLPYDTSIDMWSFGCILAELYTGFPLFPGENEVEQLSCIMECLDMPPENLILHASRRRLFFDSRGLPRTITNTKGRRRRPGSRPLSAALKCSDVAFLDLVQRCLTWDSNKRITPDEAARHPFLASRLNESSAHSNPIGSDQLSSRDREQLLDGIVAPPIKTAVNDRQVPPFIKPIAIPSPSKQVDVPTSGDTGARMISTECQTESFPRAGS